MKKILLFIFLFVSISAFAQEEFLGKWDTKIQTWNNEYKASGTMEFLKDGSCVIKNQYGTGYYEWVVEDGLLFLAGLGYKFEIKGPKQIILTPAYGESNFKLIILDKK